MNLAHDPDFIKGVGYSDGWMRNTSKPMLWEHWSHEERMMYQEACLYGIYLRCEQDSRKLRERYLVIWMAYLELMFVPVIGSKSTET